MAAAVISDEKIFRKLKLFFSNFCRCLYLYLFKEDETKIFIVSMREREIEKERERERERGSEKVNVCVCVKGGGLCVYVLLNENKKWFFRGGDVFCPGQR